LGPFLFCHDRISLTEQPDLKYGPSGAADFFFRGASGFSAFLVLPPLPSYKLLLLPSFKLPLLPSFKPQQPPSYKPQQPPSYKPQQLSSIMLQ